jgi:hypothetical protein
VTSGFQQQKTWSPEPTTHVFPRTDIAYFPQNFHRMWSPAITSLVIPRIEIARVPQNCHLYVVATTAIAHGSQKCNRMWSPEFPWHVFPRIPRHAVPSTVKRMWFPALTSVYGPNNWHCIWVPEMPSNLVTRNAVRCGPTEVPWHVVPKTDMTCEPQKLIEPSSSHINLMKKMDRLSPCTQTATEYLNLYSFQAMVPVSTVFFVKNHRFVNTGRKVKSVSSIGDKVK